MFKVFAMLFIVVAASLLHIAGSVFITIGYGSGYYIQDNFPSHLLVSSFKQIIADHVGICPSEMDIVDSYPNTAQDDDGWARFLENRTLSDYGINDFSIGTRLVAVRRISINNKVRPCQSDLTVVFLDKSAIRIRLDGLQAVLELKQLLAVKLGIPVRDQTISDWYYNPYISDDGGQALDHKQLGEYGFTTGSTGRIITVGIQIADHGTGNFTLIYSNTLMQRHVPIDIGQCVWQFKEEISHLLGVPLEGMSITTLRRNRVQDMDHGIWVDQRKVFEYGLETAGEETTLLVLTRMGCE